MANIRRYVGFPLLVACASVVACSTDADPAAPDLAGQLEKDTGMKWTVYTDPRSHEVRFMSPERPVQIGAGTPEEKARAFFARYSAALHTSGKADELRIVSSATDARGGVHIRFEHFLPGTDLPVFASGSTAHFTAEGAVYWLQSDFRADLADVDGIATVTKETAIAKALAHVKTSCGAVSGEPTAAAADLGVLSDPETHAALAYRVEISAQSEECIAPSVFIDAKSGVALKIEERAHGIDVTAHGSRFGRLNDAADTKTISVSSVPGGSGSPRFQMITAEDPSTRVLTRGFNQSRRSSRVIESQTLSEWDQSSPAKGAAVDAHHHAQKALQFLRPFASRFEPHGRAFVMPLSRDLNVYVHDNTKANRFGANAFAEFDAIQKTDNVHFGDGNFPKVPNALPFSAAFDVVTHEVTHLVTEHTSNLKYERESGALNESFSDVMGASAEHALAPDEDKNFLIGEGLFFPGPPGASALRSMTAPLSLGDPDHADIKLLCPVAPNTANVFCGVHSNSGIPNRAFSLIVGGGSLKKFEKAKTPVDRPIAVPQGIGWEQATELTYWATTGLSSTASFQNAALAQIAEASIVGGPEAFRTVTCAWHAVGVLKVSNVVDTWFVDTYCTTPPPPPGPPVANVCSGHGDAVVCDPAQPAQAIGCKNGAPADPPRTEFCADPNQRCKQVSASDGTAVFVDGVLVCE